jgi:multiple sugar transport system ATP-binding protein
VQEAARVLDITHLLDRDRASCRVGSSSAWRLAERSSGIRLAFLMDEPLSNLDAKLRVQMRS